MTTNIDPDATYAAWRLAFAANQRQLDAGLSSREGRAALAAAQLNLLKLVLPEYEKLVEEAAASSQHLAALSDLGLDVACPHAVDGDADRNRLQGDCKLCREAARKVLSNLSPCSYCFSSPHAKGCPQKGRKPAVVGTVLPSAPSTAVREAVTKVAASAMGIGFVVGGPLGALVVWLMMR